MADNGSDWLDRQTQLIGPASTARLQGSRVAVIGLGGVGGAALEALARAGIGQLFVMDCDVFQPTNINRQLLATVETLGRPKAEVAKERVLAINPGAEVTVSARAFGDDETGGLFEFAPDWVIDAIDSVTAKGALIETCYRRDIPILSCMGTGNRVHADFVVGPMLATAASGCPLARAMRRELRRRGVELERTTALFCETPPVESGARTPASISFVPPAAGFMLAGYVIREIVQKRPFGQV